MDTVPFDENAVPAEETGRIGRWLHIVRRILSVFLWLAAFGLLAMVVLLVSNVFGRAFFNLPILGAIELTQFGGVIMVSLALAYVQIQLRNVTTTIIVSRFSPRLRAAFDSVTYSLATFAVAATAWAGAEFGWEEWTVYDTVTLTLGISYAPFKAIWVIGCSLLCIVLFSQVIESVVKVVRK